MRLKAAAAALVALLVCAVARAELKPAALFCDHAVLQAGKDVTVWGWANAGQEVVVRLGETAVKTQAAKDRAWLAKLPSMKASATPVEMVISAGDEKKVIRDVLIGEVWVGSGQSNMAMAVQRTNDAERVIAAATRPGIRMFTVPRLTATKPAKDVEGKWVVCSPESVKSFSAVLYHFGRSVHEKLDVPVGLIHSSWGGTPIQAWMPRDAFKGGDEEVAALRNRIPSLYPSTTLPATSRGARRSEHLEPTRLYNAMIAPLMPYAIRGVTWYQGENNVHQGDAGEYARMMHAMVRAWRSEWRQGDWPFLFVQLAPYGNYKAPPEALPRMWAQQVQALNLISNSGMAVTMDVGDAKDIHPKEKRIVGERLAAIALAKTYGKDVPWEAPLLKAVRHQSNDVLRVQFTTPVKARAGQEVTGFELAASDGPFMKARAVVEGGEVLVTCSEVATPAQIRFQWSATAEPSLVNDAGLPAVGFWEAMY